MWSGRTGEYYTVPQGWPGWDGEIVVKEFYIWYYPEEIAREVKYLKRVSVPTKRNAESSLNCVQQVGQFVAEAEYNGIRWLVMQKFPGLPLTKTKAFKTAFQESRKVCDDVSLCLPYLPKNEKSGVPSLWTRRMAPPLWLFCGISGNMGSITTWGPLLAMTECYGMIMLKILKYLILEMTKIEIGRRQMIPTWYLGSFLMSCHRYTDVSTIYSSATLH